MRRYDPTVAVTIVVVLLWFGLVIGTGGVI
jgi:hypothetical protein